MSSHAFALLCWLSLLLTVQAGRGRGRGYHRGRGRTGHVGGYGSGYGGYGGSGRVHYLGRHNAGRTVRGRDSYGVPPAPPDECTPPCYRNYGLPGHEKCVCPDTTTMSSATASTTTPTTHSTGSTPTPSATLSTTPFTNPYTTPSITPCTTPFTTPSATSPTTPSTISFTIPSTIQPTTPTTTASTTTAPTATSPTTTPRPCEQGPSCRSGFEPFQGRCWKKKTHQDGKNMNRKEAEAECTSDSSSLASIRNEADNDFVRNMTKKDEFMTFTPVTDTSGTWWPGFEENHVHVGAYLPPDSDSHEWTWIDGTPFSYPNWVSNYPAIYPDDDEPYAAILPDFDPQKGSWDDIGEDDEARACVCAYDLC